MTVYALRTVDAEGCPVWWLFDGKRTLKGKAGQTLTRLCEEWSGEDLHADKRITELVRYKGRMRLSEAAMTVSSHRRKKS